MVRNLHKNLWIGAAVLIVASFAATQSAPHAHAAIKPTSVFVFAGQSNMVGYGARWSEGQAIDEGLGSRNIWSFSNGGLGPEVSAAKLLSARGQIAIVKLAVSGTNLHSQWNPITRNGLYSELVDQVRAAIDALDQQGMNASVKAIFWMQGESDTDTLGNASSYARNLTQFVSSLRSDLQAPAAAFFEAQIAHAGPYTDLLREQQLLAATKIPNSHLVPTDDLERCPNDPLHLDTRGIIDLGERYAGAFLVSG